MSTNSLYCTHVPHAFRFWKYISNIVFSCRFQKWRLFGHSDTSYLSNHTFNITHFICVYAFWAGSLSCVPVCNTCSKHHIIIYANVVKWSMLRVWFGREEMSEYPNKLHFWNLHEKTMSETHFQKRNTCKICMNFYTPCN